MQLQELNIRAFLPKNVASVTAGASNVNFREISVRNTI